MFRVGFAVRDLKRALPTDMPVRDAVTVRAFYAEGGGVCAVWAVLDFMDFSRPFVETIQAAICARIGLASANVHIVTTHNHSASDVMRLNLDVLACESAGAAAEARERAAPAAMRHACTTPARRVNYRRRLFVEELEGCATFWFGITEHDRFSGERLLRQTIRNLVLHGQTAYCNAGLSEPVPEERFIVERLRVNPDAFRMPEADSRLQVVAFEGEDGKCLGSFIRFAAHVATIDRRNIYSSDFPHFVRRQLETALGGTTIYLSGPCGDISPAIPDERTQDGNPLVDAICTAALSALQTACPEPLRLLMDASRTVVLPVHPEFPADDMEADRRVDALAEQLTAPGLGLADRRRLAEQVRWLRTSKLLRNMWKCLDTPDHPSGRPVIRASLGLLRLNDIALLAFPGETFSETAASAVAGFDASRVITVTEHGRTATYLPPPEEWDRGGYERSCCGISRDGEPILRAAAGALLQAQLCQKLT